MILYLNKGLENEVQFKLKFFQEYYDLTLNQNFIELLIPRSEFDGMNNLEFFADIATNYNLLTIEVKNELNETIFFTDSDYKIQLLSTKYFMDNGTCYKRGVITLVSNKED